MVLPQSEGEALKSVGGFGISQFCSLFLFVAVVEMLHNLRQSKFASLSWFNFWLFRERNERTEQQHGTRITTPTNSDPVSDV